MGRFTQPIAAASTRTIVVFATTCALLCAVALTVAVPAAHADQLAAKRAEAARIATQVDVLNARLSDLDEVARSDAAALQDEDQRLLQVTHQLAVTQASLTDGTTSLAKSLVSVYESGSVDPTLLQIAESGNVKDLITRIDDVHHASNADAAIVEHMKVLKRQVTTEKSQVAAARARAQVLAVKATKARNAAAQQVAKRQALLSSVKADVRKLVQQREAARLAAQRAAALAQKAAQAQADAANTSYAERSGSSLLSSPLVDSLAGTGSGAGAEAASVAERYLGVPYVWGGATPSGFDCSGLVMYAFAQVGVSLPHLTYAQYNMGTHVSFDQLQRGDIVFFDGEAHEGLYLGGGEFIHAPHTGTVVQIASLSGYYASAFAGAVRI